MKVAAASKRRECKEENAKEEAVKRKEDRDTSARTRKGGGWA